MSICVYKLAQTSKTFIMFLTRNLKLKLWREAASSFQQVDEEKIVFIQELNSSHCTEMSDMLYEICISAVTCEICCDADPSAVEHCGPDSRAKEIYIKLGE